MPQLDDLHAFGDCLTELQTLHRRLKVTVAGLAQQQDGIAPHARHPELLDQRLRELNAARAVFERASNNYQDAL